ncbi:nuclear transport factor 2 family protein [Microbulbifer salipaludis]|uniref:Nuclear transport factor 2 family protein n=1 Tax=Microbulbifer salipaludis TaxID=187980 RepID=A0ABS3E628_9GAMM|nr:nuclear transport factor 2 family protein [Microbulbifer salipaludis]MBN8430763.1 nuclear transport factor 2 family protein [Microbulbifer salipaludis]
MPLKTIRLTLLLTLFSGSVFADDREALNDLLNQFLAGAANDIQVHQRFWADDLIYTSSSGQRFGKAVIIDGMQKVKEEKNSRNEEDEASAPMRYRAEDTDIRLLDSTAIIAFRLIAEPASNSDKQAKRMEFFNTGTFVKRDGEWRALAWQATKIPPANSSDQ